MRVYLAGPIFGKSDEDCMAWRGEARGLLKAHVLDPMDRDYRGREDENVAAIVEGDKRDIDSCDVLLVNALHGPSWGTAMEVLYARDAGKRVVVVGDPPVSPWLRHHSVIVVPRLDTACSIINGM